MPVAKADLLEGCSAWRAFAFVIAVLSGSFLPPQLATGEPEATPRVLPGTKPLTIDEPLDEVMVGGISRFALRALEESPARRVLRWARNYSDSAVYEASVETNRGQFRTIIGAVDPREPARGFELIAKLGDEAIVARSSKFTVYAVRWPVLRGVWGEGLLLEPNVPAVARVVAVPDADWTPEMFAGIADGLGDHHPIPSILASHGVQVVVPTLISRDDSFSGDTLVGFTNQPHREFIYRQAFTMGRHVIGYEVQKIEAAIDQLEYLNRQQKMDLPIGVAGVGEGGLLAFYAAALDRRIDSALISGYFQKRESMWQEPIYRNVWGLLAEFGDADIASLIVPRALTVEACAVPHVDGPPQVREGRRGGAAPGVIKTCALNDVQTEFRLAEQHYAQLGSPAQISLVSIGDGAGSSGSAAAIEKFIQTLNVELSENVNLDQTPPLTHSKHQIDPTGRQRRQVAELTDFTQNLLELSPKVRDAFWSKADRSSIDAWKQSAARYRDYVWEEMIGKLPPPDMPLNVRTRQVLAEADFVGYEVAIDVYPDVIAAGILLLPKAMSADEERPLVICQHGLEGVSMDTITARDDAYRYYKSFAAELAKRGFIVYAPQNPYRGGDRFRVLQRQSNPLKLSLFSYIIRQYQRTLDWLETLPNVDAKRIGFYGLSYGGKTAMRVPTILHDRFAVCICSGDFNEWIRKMVSRTDSYSYVYTGEYEMPEWNMGHVAGYAELACLFSPRPFMVERGHSDGVAPDEWVAWEFAKVRCHYAQLGIADRCTIEFFNGPHTINGVGTYEFLHKHLGWNPSEN